ncbi:MAG: GNAT family N-acetyltransferase [Armatimonadetes bacterium]|nr:GNAT family N-acetyltransferase [Armatimonadota bacterium]
MSQIPTLETERLILRPLRREDAPRIQELFPDFEVVRYLYSFVPWPYPDNGANEFLDMCLPQIERGERIIWAMTLREAADDLLIGVVYMNPGGPHHRSFWLAPRYHRLGLMTEAVAAFNDYFFDVLGNPVIRSGNAVPNLGSRRIKEKTGAKLVDVKPDASFVEGVFDEEIWELTAEDWRANRTGFVAKREGA